MEPKVGFFFLNKKKEMQDENGRLRKVLAEKEYEINYLKKKVDEDALLGGGGGGSGDAAASKIVELAKKVRELTAQMESERSKNKQLTKTCKDLESKLENFKDMTANRSRNDDDHDGDDGDDLENEKKVSLQKENKELRDKFNQTSHKMMEYKSQCEILKQDLKKTQKVTPKKSQKKKAWS
jgi:chromosome segregation ATPase